MADPATCLFGYFVKLDASGGCVRLYQTQLYQTFPLLSIFVGVTPFKKHLHCSQNQPCCKDKICTRRPLDMLKETSGQLRFVSDATKSRYFLHEVWRSPALFGVIKTGILSQNITFS